MPKAPVYFFSHGGASTPSSLILTHSHALSTNTPQPDVQYNTTHPVYPILQAIGKEITQKVKPKAVVVFSAHWQADKANEIHLNNAEDTDLIYE
jgi:4,5-DOPA dioxygenase extradiol